MYNFTLYSIRSYNLWANSFVYLTFGNNTIQRSNQVLSTSVISFYNENLRAFLHSVVVINIIPDLQMREKLKLVQGYKDNRELSYSPSALLTAQYPISRLCFSLITTDFSTEHLKRIYQPS